MYMHDVYDLKVVRKVSLRLYSLASRTDPCQVLVTLLSQHGIEPSAVKSDLYTLAGLDSSHPTKLRSSIWRPMEVIEGGKEAIEASHLTFEAFLAD